MSDNSTKLMLKGFEEIAEPSDFFLQRTTPVFHNQEKVEWDVIRDGELVAPVVEIASGSNMNVADVYTNKEVIPPLYNEGFTLNAWELMGRDFDQNPFANNDFRVKANTRILRGSRKVQSKVARALNLQASQILNSGVISIKDPKGNVSYTMDYGAKATHFPTTGTPWTGGAGDPIGDILALCQVVKQDGKMAPDMLIMGEASYEAALQNEEFEKRLNLRRGDMIEIIPLAKSGGANRRGHIDIGSYKLEIWTDNSEYQETLGGAYSKYQADDQVIVMSSKTRLDATYGSIPRIVSPDPRLSFVPGRMSSATGNFDLSFNAYVDNSGTNLTTEVGTRALIIPISIDTFGSLNTGV